MRMDDFHHTTRRSLIMAAGRSLGASLIIGALPKPPALAQDASAALAAQLGEAHLLGPAAPATPLFTYGGSLPGPTLRQKLGDDFGFQFQNRLSEPTALSFGGYPVPANMLGVPGLSGQAVAPGANTDIRFPLTEAGTYLYAPFDAGQAARGLAGALVVEDATPPEADRDLVLVIQDWRLAPDQRIHLTVNGSPAAKLAARAGERVRLRIVNATRGLFLPLKLDDHPCWIISIDGRPAEPFPPSEGRLLMAPGSRVDVLVDLVKPPGAQLALALEMADGEVPLAALAYSAEAALRTTPLPAPQALPMANAAAQPKLAGATRLTLEFGDEPAPNFLPEALASVAAGRTLVATVTNRSASTASVHLYGHAARLLDTLDDGWKPWWHDTVGVASGKTIRLAFIARAPGRWPLVARRGGDGVPLALGWFETTGQATPGQAISGQSTPADAAPADQPAIPMPPKKPR
ncbi:multicopper oxidase family protein [Starkeya sp. ORNL1]|uniref:multicopper oxidase family protein n=1 Tax=Starkeya sp. ORNL1 TaxID=2709380 RepID=UPI001FEE2BE0|nr:multicopper oxidase family protein [Starkeya sp. ORNL1]